MTITLAEALADIRDLDTLGYPWSVSDFESFAPKRAAVIAAILNAVSERILVEATAVSAAIEAAAGS
jgi:hypothetical protein